MIIKLSEALKLLKEKYALNCPPSSQMVKNAFLKILKRDFKGARFDEFIVKITKKGSRLIISVTHPAIIQELEGIAIPLIAATNKELGENIILDIDFKVVSYKP